MSDRYSLLAGSSALVTFLALVVPWIPRIFGSQYELSTLIDLLLFLPAAWAIVTIVGVVIYRVRALWLLLGAPVALFNLTWFMLTFSPCDPTGLRCL